MSPFAISMKLTIAKEVTMHHYSFDEWCSVCSSIDESVGLRKRLTCEDVPIRKAVLTGGRHIKNMLICDEHIDKFKDECKKDGIEVIET